MSCGCNNGKPDDKFDHMRYMRQHPTHHHGCGCHHKPLFMPFQPPPWLGPCCPPPPPQNGPWEYTPSTMYPGPPPCCGHRGPHIPPPYGGCHHHHHMHGPAFNYECLPQQAPACGCRPHWPNPLGPMPPIPPRPLPAPPPDPPEIKNPNHKHFVHKVDGIDGKAVIVQEANGIIDVLAKGYIPSMDGEKGNGPRCWHSHDIRGDISGSEGLDTVNFQFNTSNAGSNF